MAKGNGSTRSSSSSSPRGLATGEEARAIRTLVPIRSVINAHYTEFEEQENAYFLTIDEVNSREDAKLARNGWVMQNNGVSFDNKEGTGYLYTKLKNRR